MLPLQSFTGVLASLALAAAVAVKDPVVLHESVRTLPEGWTLRSRVHGSERVSLSVALRSAGMDGLKARLLRNSDPAHPEYGRHMTRDEVLAAHAPSAQSVEAVQSWLEAAGVTERLAEGAWVHFNTTVGKANELLQTALGWYVFDDDESRAVVRAMGYSLPGSLARDHVDFVYPVTNFVPPTWAKARTERSMELRRREMARLGKRALPAPLPSTSRADFNPLDDRLEPEVIRPSAEAVCARGVEPACLRELYNIRYTPSTSDPSPVRFGVAGFLEQYINHEDVSSFLARYAPAIPSTHNFTLIELAGAKNSYRPGDGTMEANLDVQYSMALGYPTNVIYYLHGGRGPKLDITGKPYPEHRSDNEPYLEWLEYLLSLPDTELPHVMSVSYADDEQSLPRAYATRVCDLFASLAARGTTVVVATGDGGARGQAQTECVSNDGSGRRMFIPTFPASCPYVVAVGATTNEENPPVAAAFSTGGFSNYFAMPDFQTAVTAPYMTKLPETHGSMFNASGRATPDISAVGSIFTILLNNYTTGVLGTSASAPVIAAMIALANDARMRASPPKGPLGWLTPLLYKSDAVRSAMSDVVGGESDGCRWTGGDSIDGWPALDGWDAVTGLGEVADFEKWRAALMTV